MNGASVTDLQSQKDNLHASQSELSNGAMNAIELVKDHHAAANGLNSYINNMNFSLNSKASEAASGHKQSVFNRVNTGSNIGGRENAFSVSGQKVVHFKDAATTDQLSSDERKSNLKIFVLPRLKAESPNHYSFLSHHREFEISPKRATSTSPLSFSERFQSCSKVLGSEQSSQRQYGSCRCCFS